MSGAELHTLGLHALSGLLASRSLGSLELTDALIARAEAMADLHAFVTPRFDQARETARRIDADASAPRGPLTGIPVGIKDAFDLAGVETQLCGQYTPDADAVAVTALERAGMVLMGKLHCAEYCLGAPGGKDRMPFAENPRARDRSPGTSSSGSGVALAAGLLPAALGTDTGGSIRIPAAFCGVTGLKPTGGLVSKDGVFPLAPSLDQVGPMARDSRDCALLLEALTGLSGSLTGASTERLDGLRIGYVRAFGDDPRVAEDQRAAVGEALRVLAGLGASVRDVDLPPLQDFAECYMALMVSEAQALHGDAMRRDETISANTRDRIIGVAPYSDAAVARAREARKLLTRGLDDVWSDVDLLVWEAAAGDPPRVAEIASGDYRNAPMLFVPANIADTPALVTRAGTSRAGLPVGVHIVGPRGADATVLRSGHALEQARGPLA